MSSFHKQHNASTTSGQNFSEDGTSHPVDAASDAAKGASPAQTYNKPAATDGSWKKANSTRDNDSLAPLVNSEDEADPSGERRKSWYKRLSDSHHHDKSKEKKKSIADSGPFIFVYSPELGKEVLQKNPHWPNEDTWKREKEVEGQWAFGSVMGQQNVDFGGTV